MSTNPFERECKQELYFFFNASRDSSVIIVTRLRAVQLRNRVRFPEEVRDLCHLRNVQTGSVTHPASYSVGTGGALYPVANRPGREADHLLLLSAEVKKCGEVYLHSPPPISLRNVHRDALTVFLDNLHQVRL